MRDAFQVIHDLIRHQEQDIRWLKSQLAQFSSGGTILSGSSAPHGLLSAMHTDTTPAGPVDGAIIVGNNLGKWARRDAYSDVGLLVPGTSVFMARKDHGHEHLIGGEQGDVLFDASGLTDGVTTTFQMPDFFEEDSTRVYMNGLIQRPLIDYNEGAALGSIVMTVAPGTNDELVAVYMMQEAP